MATNFHSTTLQHNEGDGLVVAADTAAGIKTRDASALNSLGSARSDPMQQMRGWTPVPHQRAVAGRGGGLGGGGGALAQVSDSEISGNAGAGVRVQQASATCKVRRSQIQHSGRDGVRAENGGEARIFDSRIEGNRASGAAALGRGARCLLAATSVVSNGIGACAQGGEVRLHQSKMGRNRESEVRTRVAYKSQTQTCDQLVTEYEE
jgi:hypothetical protein